MTEEQIERAVEREIDQLDRRFMAGEISETAYDLTMNFIRKLAESEYAKMRRRQEEN